MVGIVRYFFVIYLVLLNPVSGIILCWGGEGHIAIESALTAEECCDHVQPLNSQAITEWQDYNSNCECHPCLDILLSFQSNHEILLSPPLDVSAFLTNVVHPQTRQFIITDTKPLVIAPSEFRPSATLPFLKTVQLLN